MECDEVSEVDNLMATGVGDRERAVHKAEPTPLAWLGDGVWMYYATFMMCIQLQMPSCRDVVLDVPTIERGFDSDGDLGPSEGGN